MSVRDVGGSPVIMYHVLGCTVSPPLAPPPGRAVPRPPHPLTTANSSAWGGGGGGVPVVGMLSCKL